MLNITQILKSGCKVKNFKFYLINFGLCLYICLKIYEMDEFEYSYMPKNIID